MRPLPLNLFMTTDAVGGVLTYALDLGRALAPFGVKITLAVLGPAMSDQQRAEARAIKNLELLETGLPLDWLASSPAEVASCANAVAALARTAGAQLVHLNTPTLAVAGFDAPVVGVTHSCLASWWASVESGPLPPDFIWRTQMLREGLQRADAVVCPSRSYAATVCDLYRIAPFVVRNGRAAPPSRDRTPHEAPAFAFSSGRLWDRGKNAETLDAAAEHMNLPLYYAGPCKSPQGGSFDARHGKPVGALEADAIRQSLAERPIFVSAALYEPFGLSVLEAAQAGCPLVLSDIPSFRELRHGAALFVSPRFAGGFAASVNIIAADGALRDDLRAAAEQRAGEYGLETMARSMVAIYRAALARTGPAIASSLTGAVA